MQKTILVVDDFASIRNFVCATLQRKGYSTLGASNGNEAYKILTDNADKVNVVLTDYNMPDLSGFDLLKKIKGNPAISDVPVIFLTTELSYDKMKNAKEAGLFAWIKKPYQLEEFFAQIEKAANATVKSI
jgi:two-component system chemotaxis response regulator CheY